MVHRYVRTGLTVCAVALVVGAVTYAQGPGAGRRGAPSARPEATLGIRGLDLSDTQRQQIRELTEQRRDEARAALARVQAARGEQRKALSVLPVNEGLIRSTTQALAEAQTEVALQQARLRSEIFALLTTEQQAQAQTLMAERETRLQQRRERVRERLQERRDQRRRG
jgi:protein CpxP